MVLFSPKITDHVEYLTQEPQREQGKMILSSPWTIWTMCLSQMQTSCPGFGVTPPSMATQHLAPSHLSSLFLGVFESKFSLYFIFQLCCPPCFSLHVAAVPHPKPQLVLYTPPGFHTALLAWQKLTAPPMQLKQHLLQEASPD